MIAPVTLSWVACDLRTGLILEELKSLSPSGAIGRRLGTSATANADLVLAGAPALWQDATTPGRTMLVAIDELMQVPVWAGIVLTRARGTAQTCTLGLVTPEAYFDRRYTGTYSVAVATDQALILTGLGTALAVNAPNFLFDAPASGVTLDSYAVLDGDDRTILSTWQEIMGQGDIEFTVDPVWQDAAHTTVQLVIRIRPQIGTQSSTPEPVFDYPGNIADYVQTESYESGKGATDVQANGNGQGATRLVSADHSATSLLASGFPSWVYRFTPAAGLDDPVQLDAHAAEALAQMSTGSSTWTVTAVASQSPRVGSDWGLGDSVHLQISTSPGHPNGADVVARAYGWDLDAGANTVTPILVEGS